MKLWWKWNRITSKYVLRMTGKMLYINKNQMSTPMLCPDVRSYR